MDGGGGHAAIVEEIIDVVDSTFVVAEDDGAGWWKSQQQIEQAHLLFIFVHLDNLSVRMTRPTESTHLLHNVHMGTANTADADSDVVFGHVLFGQLTCFAREGGGKHHIDMFLTFLCFCLSILHDSLRSTYRR